MFGFACPENARFAHALQTKSFTRRKINNRRLAWFLNKNTPRHVSPLSLVRQLFYIRSQVPTARFQTVLGSPVIDEAAGVIRGCRIATLGAVSQASKENGGGLVMDAVTIDGLLSLAKLNGDKVPVFFSHDWFESDKDPLHSDAGVWQDHRLEVGSLFADFHAFETPYKAGIFSRAKLHPEGIAVSPVFDYTQRNGDKSLCTPTRFISSDFVKNGAINKALFAEGDANPMDINQLIAALKDPAVLAAIKSIVSSVEKTNDEAMTTEAADAIETEAGVMAEDRKETDAAQPALLRAALRISRATARQAKAAADSVKALGDSRTAILAEATTKAEANFTANLGKNGFIGHGDNKGDNADEFTAKLSEYRQGGKVNDAVAEARIARDFPDLYEKRRATLFQKH